MNSITKIIKKIVNIFYMSGHSKWSNIQHRKHNQDNKKSKKFSKIIKDIISIVKESGKNNSRFKNAISAAKSLNIPKKTIENAINKSKIKCSKINVEGKIYGIGIIIECKTDNSIRTISNIKTLFQKNGGKLCNNGELIHLFSRTGIFYIEEKNISHTLEDFELMMIDFGAKDFFKKKNEINIIVDFKYFGFMKNNLKKLNIPYTYKLKRIPNQTRNISTEKREKIKKMIDNIKKNEDITSISSTLGNR